MVMNKGETCRDGDGARTAKRMAITTPVLMSRKPRKEESGLRRHS